MKVLEGLALAALLAIGPAAFAHTHLKEAVPAEGSTVTASPQNIVLQFTGAARVTSLTIQSEGGKEEKLAPLPEIPAARISVPVPKLSPGKYTVSWRVMGADNHVMSGKVHFTVAAPASGA